jgi:hypothetical protein
MPHCLHSNELPRLAPLIHGGLYSPFPAGVLPARDELPRQRGKPFIFSNPPHAAHPFSFIHHHTPAQVPPTPLLTLLSSSRLQVLVDTLANSKTFQRFAIRSNAVFSDMAKKGTVHHQSVTQKSTEFMQTFREELTKGMKDIHKGGRP